MSSNAIGDSGATAIAGALKSNTVLTTLHLRGNDIGDSGAAAITEALKSNTALTTLDLSYNIFGIDGMTAGDNPAPPSANGTTAALQRALLRCTAASLSPPRRLTLNC